MIRYLFIMLLGSMTAGGSYPCWRVARLDSGGTPRSHDDHQDNNG